MGEGQRQRNAAQFGRAAASFREAAEIARKTNSLQQEASALKSLSGCQIREFLYREALQSSESARWLALRINDDALAGAATNNEATIYQQLGDYSSAEKAAGEAVVLLEHADRRDYFVSALLNYGDIESQLGNMHGSVDAFQKAIAAAQLAQHSPSAANTDFLSIEALGWDHLGSSLIDLRDFFGAEKALKEAERLHLRQHDADSVAVTTANLAYLAYQKREFSAASKLLDKVISSHSHVLLTLPPYWPSHLRGAILRGLDQRAAALASFGDAVTRANEWRRDALPGDTTSTQTVVALHEVYQDYIELASDLALRRHNPKLAANAFMVLARNRASSLREQMLLALGREMRLPPRYFELLSSLQSAQAAVTLGQNKKSAEERKAKLEKIRFDLSDLENKIGLQQESFSVPTEKNDHRTSLRDIRESLSSTELLLSFCLGKERSFLFALTRDDMRLYELPPQDKLAVHASAFSRAVQRGSAVAEGALLSRELFGKLTPRELQKPDWLIAADGALLDSVPFGALPQPAKLTAPITDSHSLRLLPSELLLADAKPPEPSKRFVGVADPIYNQADSRLTRPFTLFPAHHVESTIILARLAGSEREVRSSARLIGISNVVLLSGRNATSQNLRAALGSAPEILHFAVHVVSPQDRKGHSAEAALALSLTSDNMPELLTKEVIATLRVPGSLVVLSGCASQQGENLPTAGLVGLSRAWLLAGASAVVVSAWPTPDDSGHFFTTFYQHLQSQPAQTGNLAKRASVALQKTQGDMQRSSDYRSSPSFWAAYSLISKE